MPAVVSGAVVDSRVHDEESVADADGCRCGVKDQGMQIQVNTDSNVSGGEERADRIAATVEARLVRFGDYLTGVQVHLADESAGRPTGADHRCTIEARPAGRQPVAVTSHAPTVDESVASALGKLVTVLAREHDRRDHHKGSASIRTAGGEENAPAANTDGDAEAQPRIGPDTTEG